MKQLKFNHVSAQAIVHDNLRITWRVADDKGLEIDDQFEVIDQVLTQEPSTWRTVGVGTIDAIDQKRLGQLTADELAGIEAESPTALLSISRQYYGERVSADTPVKLVKFHFEPYQEPQIPANKVVHEKVKLFADGGSRGNPGPSASGYAVLDQDDTVIVKSGIYLGITTNNQAEYQAVKFGLEAAKKIGAREVSVYLDSLLVVNQMNGQFKIKNRDLWPIHQAIKELVGKFSRVTFTHVPREHNTLADAEVNETLDAERG